MKRIKKLLMVTVVCLTALCIISCGNSVKKGEILIYFSENGKKLDIEPVRIDTEIKASRVEELSSAERDAILSAYFFETITKGQLRLGDKYTYVNSNFYSDEACTQSLSENEFTALLIDKGVIAYFNCEKKEN